MRGKVFEMSRLHRTGENSGVRLVDHNLVYGERGEFYNRCSWSVRAPPGRAPDYINRERNKKDRNPAGDGSRRSRGSGGGGEESPARKRHFGQRSAGDTKGTMGLLCKSDVSNEMCIIYGGANSFPFCQVSHGCVPRWRSSKIIQCVEFEIFILRTFFFDLHDQFKLHRKQTQTHVCTRPRFNTLRFSNPSHNHIVVKSSLQFFQPSQVSAANCSDKSVS